MKLSKYIVLIGAVCAAFTMQPAKADVFTSTIDSGNDVISGFTGPYAEVKIVLTSSTTADVTFTSDIVGGNIYLMGGAQGTDLNLASAATPSGFTFSQAGQTGFSSPSETGFSSQNVDGKGTFSLAIDYFNGFDHAFNEVTFTLTKDSGTWASAGDILTGNALGFDAAAHIFVTSFPAILSNGAINTGFAAETGGGIVTPDSGTTAMLLGLGLSGLGFVRRFVKR